MKSRFFKDNLPCGCKVRQHQALDMVRAAQSRQSSAHHSCASPSIADLHTGKCESLNPCTCSP